MRVVDQSTLLALVEQAEHASRRRMNLNLHDAPEDPIQRLFNAIEPQSYVRPHCHIDPVRWELMLAIRGACAVLTFEPDGVVSGRAELVAGGDSVAVQLQPGTWHSVVAMQPGTVFFEVKQGPYIKPAPEAFASWAPPEGAPQCPAFVDWYRCAVPGDRPPALL